VESAILAENWLAAYAASQLMALDRSPTEIVKNYYVVAVNLFITDEREKALTLLDQLIAARPVEESREQIIQVADRLLEERLFQPAYRLYRHAAVNANDIDGKHHVLRCAYLCLELGDPEGCERFLIEAKAIDAEDAESRGTEQLIFGVKAFQAGDMNLALNHLAHGMAQVSSTSCLKQIGLYFNFLGYSNLENTEIAQNILDEMSLLFPQGAYSEALAAELEPESTTVNESL
jgi:tetratricopeptide (TPR) repeat protein